MDIETFLQMRPTWAYEPCLYIVKQMFPGNNAYRSGAAGTQLFKNADFDLVYGADKSGSLTGLLGRMTMYRNYWMPLKGTLYAALRIKKQLVARPGQRVGIDSVGEQYNIDRGNQTLVLQREAEMHAEMDRRGLRWQDDKKNELFAPRKGVEELIDAMRTIRGEDLYLFDKETIQEDVSYTGGVERAEIINTTKRALPTRAAATEIRAPTVTLKLSRKAVEELQTLNPKKFLDLVDIIDLVTGRAKQKQSPPPPPEPVEPIVRPMDEAPPERRRRTRAEILRTITARFNAVPRN